MSESVLVFWLSMQRHMVTKLAARSVQLMMAHPAAKRDHGAAEILARHHPAAKRDHGAAKILVNSEEKPSP
jgi:hypothetical protein